MDPFRAIPFVDWFTSREFQITADMRHVPVLPADFPFLIRCYDFSATSRLVPNRHDYLEINFVHSGKGILHVENTAYRIREGDLFLVGNDKMHLLEAFHEQHIRVVCLYFLPEIIHHPGLKGQDFQYLIPFYRWEDFLSKEGPPLPKRDKERIVGLIRIIHDEVSRRREHHTLAVKNALCEILLIFLRNAVPAPKTAVNRHPRPEALRRLKPVFDFIHGSYGKKITGETLAARACMSRAYLCRFFKRVTGVTPTGYILRYRIDKAKELLLGTDLPVTEIAYQVGFESQSYFDRTFARFVRQPPRRFRELHQGQNRASFRQ